MIFKGFTIETNDEANREIFVGKGENNEAFAIKVIRDFKDDKNPTCSFKIENGKVYSDIVFSNETLELILRMYQLLNKFSYEDIPSDITI